MREKGFLLLRLLFDELELSNKTTTLTILQSNTKGRLGGAVFTHWGHKCSLGTSLGSAFQDRLHQSPPCGVGMQTP